MSLYSETLTFMLTFLVKNNVFVLFASIFLLIFLVKRLRIQDIESITPFVLVCLGMFIFIALEFLSYEVKNVTKREVDVPIYSLQTTQVRSGNFVLGSGQIESDVIYYVFVKDKSGKKLKGFDAKNTYINETDVSKPYVKCIYEVRCFWDGGVSERLKESILYVPVGTIVEDYDTKVVK